VSAVAAGLTVAILLNLVSSPVVGQSPPPPAGPAGPAAKTPWGAPDLQGIWNDPYDVPTERPARYGNKEFLTDAERAELDKARVEAMSKTDGRRYKPGSEQDVGLAYSTLVFQSLRPTGRRTSLVVDPPDGRLPPRTAEVSKREAALREFQLTLLQATEACKNKLPGCAGGTYGPPSPKYHDVPPVYLGGGMAPGGSAGIINRSDGPEDRSLSERCITGGGPSMGGYIRIVQSRDALSISYDVGQGSMWQRLVPITDRPHLPAAIRQSGGDSRGRWDGETLVVDITNFAERLDRFSESKGGRHLVERFTRRDAGTLEYVLTTDDPATFTRPYTVKVELARQDARANRQYREPRCHEGNYALSTLLAGARAEERAFQQGKGRDPRTVCTAGCGGFAREDAGAQDSGDERER
jgi:hypothetical protein